MLKKNHDIVEIPIISPNKFAVLLWALYLCNQNNNSLDY